MKEVNSGPDQLKVSLDIAKASPSTKSADEKSSESSKTFRGFSAGSDINEALQKAVSQARKDLATDYVRWRLIRFESQADGMQAIIGAATPSVSPQRTQPPADEQGGKAIQGSSNKGDVRDAFMNTIQEAKQKVKSEQVTIGSINISGGSGGFTNEQRIIVTGTSK